MALTFPLTMPTGGGDGVSFTILRNDYLSPETGGRQGAVTAGFPLWSMELDLQNGTADDLDEWIAFIDALRGSQRTFLGRDLTRVFPKRYPDGFEGMSRAGGDAFDGAATTWSVNGTRDVLTVQGLPASFQVSLRDYVGFQWLTSTQKRRALVRAVEPMVGSAGGVASFAIEPALPTLVPSNAVATFAEPDCLMKIVRDQTRLGKLDTLHSAGGTVTAVQDLLP